MGALAANHGDMPRGRSMCAVLTAQLDLDGTSAERARERFAAGNKSAVTVELLHRTRGVGEDVRPSALRRPG